MDNCSGGIGATPGRNVEREAGTPSALAELASHSQMMLLAVYTVVGHGLLLVAIVTGYNAWHLLAEYRAPILWAFLCATALRGVNDRLLSYLSKHLEHKSLCESFLGVMYSLPVLFFRQIWSVIAGEGSSQSGVYFKALALAAAAHKLWPISIIAAASALAAWGLCLCFERPVQVRRAVLAGGARALCRGWGKRWTQGGQTTPTPMEGEPGTSKSPRNKKQKQRSAFKSRLVSANSQLDSEEKKEGGSTGSCTPPSASAAGPGVAGAASRSSPRQGLRKRHHARKNSPNIHNQEETHPPVHGSTGTSKRKLPRLTAVVGECTRMARWLGGAVGLAVREVDLTLAKMLLSALRPICAMCTVMLLLTSTVALGLYSTGRVVGELHALLLDVESVMDDSGSVVGETVHAGHATVQRALRSYLPLMMQNTQPLFAHMERHMRNNNLTQLADALSEFYPALQPYAAALAAEMQAGDPLGMWRWGRCGARYHNASSQYHNSSGHHLDSAEQQGGSGADVCKGVGAFLPASSPELQEAVDWAGRVQHTLAIGATRLQDLLQAVFGLHWNKVHEKWWRMCDWVKEMQPHFSHISETDSMNSIGKTWKEWASHSMRAGMVVARSGLSVAARAGGVVAHTLARTCTLAVRVSQDATRLVVFITTLYYILAAERHLIEEAVGAFPISEDDQQEVVAALSNAVRGVFQSSVRVWLFHAGLTWVLFSVFGVTRMLYISMLVSGTLSILPFPPNYIVTLPAVLQLAAQGQFWSGVLLALIYFFTSTSAFHAIYEDIPSSPHPYLTGLSVLGGMNVFRPAINGAIMGPMLLVAMSCGFNLYKAFLDRGKQDRLTVQAARRQARRFSLKETLLREDSLVKACFSNISEKFYSRYRPDTGFVGKQALGSMEQAARKISFVDMDTPH